MQKLICCLQQYLYFDSAFPIEITFYLIPWWGGGDLPLVGDLWAV